MQDNFNNAISLSRYILEKVLTKGDTAVDCTAGNGNDTSFLCDLVGASGRVYAFDIQKKALENTKSRLCAEGKAERVKLINDGHENLDKYISEKVKVAVFNLGYLPGDTHNIITKAETTIEALKKLLDKISQKGAVVINVYYGHEGGKTEKEAVEKFCVSLNQKKYNVFVTKFINQINCPPELICIEKRV